MKLFGRNNNLGVKVRGAAPTTEDNGFAARVAAMNQRASNAVTTEDALGVMQEAASITNDLMKAVSAMSDQSPEVASSDAAENASGDVSNDDLDTTTDGTDEPVTDGTVTNDTATDETAVGNTTTDDVASDVENPTDANAPDKQDKFAKGVGAQNVDEILAQAQQIAAANGAELQVDASSLVNGLLKAVAASQQQSETTNDYLEQLGALLTKSVEGIGIIAENQSALHQNQQALDERLGRIEQVQQEMLLGGAKQPDELAKSLTDIIDARLQPALGFINSARQAPRATLTGRAPVAANAVAGVVLADAAPILEPPQESHLGFTRDDLRKGIEAHIRSDRSKDTGITTQHFTSIRSTPLEDLDPLIYEVVSKELKRPLPGSSSP